MLRLVRWARSRRTTVGTVLLASLLAGPLVLPHADPLGDAACHPAAAAHDPDAHRIEAAPAGHDDHAQHCFACHLVRSFSCLLRATGSLDRSADRVGRLYVTHVAARTTVGWTLLPGRAPPA